ncbi:MAG TPA: hypothetical protein VIT88_09975 [Pyrinomonadaceae bacterium]
MKTKWLLSACLLASLCHVPSSVAQERARTEAKPDLTVTQDPPQELVRVDTRAVFIDTLVWDKKTGMPVRDLTSENFEVLDDGKSRKISYFSREGLSRRPLALVLSLDLHTSGILYLENPEVMEHIISALAKLQPEDEVAVVQTWFEPEATPLSFQLRSKVVEGLTRDRAKTFAALRSVQEFAKQNLPQVKLFFTFGDAMKAIWKGQILAGSAGTAGSEAGNGPIRTTVAPDFQNPIETSPLLAKSHPGSQVIILEVTDDFGIERLGKTKDIARDLIASNVTVSCLVMKKNLMDKAVNALGTLTSPLVGARFHTVSYYGKQTGGEVTEVGSPNEFTAAIDRLIGGIAARYSIGFTLEAAELNDGRMHKLEVKIKDRNERGKQRKLIVNARKGYIPRR